MHLLCCQRLVSKNHVGYLQEFKNSGVSITVGLMLLGNKLEVHRLLTLHQGMCIIPYVWFIQKIWMVEIQMV